MSAQQLNQSGMSSDQSVNSDEDYEVLDLITNKKKPLEVEVIKEKQKDEIEKKEESPKDNDDSKPVELENEKERHCCFKCMGLETKLKEVSLEKERVVEELMKQTKRLEVLEKKKSENEGPVVSQEEYEYCLTSFQEIIKSYQEEHSKILKVVGDTLKINFNHTNKSLFQIIDNIVTEFMVNFREISLELNCLERESCVETFGEDFEQDKGNYGYYYALHKIENIRENVQRLKKTRNDS